VKFYVKYSINVGHLLLCSLGFKSAVSIIPIEIQIVNYLANNTPGDNLFAECNLLDFCCSYFPFNWICSITFPLKMQCSIIAHNHMPNCCSWHWSNVKKLWWYKNHSDWESCLPNVSNCLVSCSGLYLT